MLKKFMASTPHKKTRKLTTLELSAPARGALRRIAQKKGWTNVRTVEMCLLTFESGLAAAPGGRGL